MRQDKYFQNARIQLILASCIFFLFACSEESKTPIDQDNRAIGDGVAVNSSNEAAVVEATQKKEQHAKQDFLIRTQEEFNQKIADAKAGDSFILADGVWHDFEILFTGEGTKDKPIKLTAETKGKVILSGQSNLKLAGEYLIVSGLVFKNGFTPTKEVISFRRTKDHVANHSRVTEVVIDDYNQPERQEVDFWVMMYGKHNRFDHNHLVNKRNKGVTMAVRLNTEASQENHHRIDHNYFGPRQILGSNGGETLRIGTSHYSLTDSHSIVENNYFDRCDGELEIISVKSGRNIVRNNSFHKSRGTLTMRHGNNNIIENNVFFGEGADHTGGIRVINEGQIIRNNYMEGLTGVRFGGALVVMNGVPNSPINRYHQVKNAVVSNHSLINSDNIQLGAGSDAERSAVPIDSEFAGNLIFNAEPRDIFTVYDDMSGIAFKDNLASQPPKSLSATGFAPLNTNFERAENGLLYPTDEAITAGVSRDVKPTTKEMTGVSWYPKAGPLTAFGSGDIIDVGPGQNALFDAVKKAGDGDLIRLTAGSYVEEKAIKLGKTLSFESDGGTEIAFERSTLFQIEPGGSLKLKGLTITGKSSPDNAGNSVIRTSPYAMLPNYRLIIEESQFVDLDINHSFSAIKGAKGTFTDQIVVKNSSFKNISGAVIKLDREDDDYGIYNAEYIDISDSHFENIGWAVASIYRGGRDESTFGPHFSLTDSIFERVGHDKRNKKNGSLFLHGVQVSNISGNEFREAKPFIIDHTVGEPKTKIVQNKFWQTARPIVRELNSELQNTAVIKNNSWVEADTP